MTTIDAIPVVPTANGHYEPKRYTMAEFDTMDNKRLELVDGQLVETGMGAKSARTGGKLFARIDAYASETKSGFAFPADCAYLFQVAEREVLRVPDASFVSKSRLPIVPEGRIRLAPDFAAEVVSPNELVEELDDKVAEFLKAGVRLVWVIHPKAKSVVIHRPNKRPHVMYCGETLSGEDVLPGFTVTLDELLAD